MHGAGIDGGPALAQGLDEGTRDRCSPASTGEAQVGDSALRESVGEGVERVCDEGARRLASTRTLTFPTPSVLGYSNCTGSPCFSTKCGRLPSIRALPPPFT